MQDDKIIVVKYIHDVMEANNTAHDLQIDSCNMWENRKISRVTFTAKHGNIHHVSVRKKSCHRGRSSCQCRNGIPKLLSSMSNECMMVSILDTINFEIQISVTNNIWTQVCIIFQGVTKFMIRRWSNKHKPAIYGHDLHSQNWHVAQTETCPHDLRSSIHMGTQAVTCIYGHT